MATERLAKWLAHAGVASRRSAEDLIAAGAVRVNGTVITEQGYKIDPAADQVEVNGRAIQPPVSEHITVAIHKPVGYVSTAHDPQGRPIVADLLPPELRARRLVPVGRLDADSSGLLLLSDDGDLALRLTHPRYGATKLYHALVRGELTAAEVDQLRRGVVLAGEDPRPTAPAQVWRLAPASRLPVLPTMDQEDLVWYGVTLHEGRKRQVRLMFAAVGAPVVELVRTQIGRLTLAATVPEPGACRVLSAAEIALALAGTHDAVAPPA